MTATSLDVSDAISDPRKRLLEHALYARLGTVGDLRIFMEAHVYAVWDFMSLLKALQVPLTCVATPWLPPPHARLARMVNEIVLGEESDVLPDGGVASHFEIYLAAMEETGASTASITNFIDALRNGATVEDALEIASPPPGVREFVRHTFAIIRSGSLPAIASAFTYGREDLIPDMFGEMVAQLHTAEPEKLATYRYYLDRHIELDGDEHGALGREMVELLCEGDPVKQREATDAAVAALESRILLWDHVLESIGKNS